METYLGFFHQMENSKNTAITYINPAMKYKKKEDQIVNIVYTHYIVYQLAPPVFPCSSVYMNMAMTKGKSSGSIWQSTYRGQYSVVSNEIYDHNEQAI